MSRLLALSWIAMMLAGGSPARAQTLTADLSDHLIAITTGYTGTRIVLFGAAQGEGDVVVVVRGPDTAVVTRRKGRLGPIWINRTAVTFSGVPAFYAVAGSKPLDEFVPPAVRRRHQIGFSYLRFVPDQAMHPDDLAAFRAGLIRNMQRADLFPETEGKVTFAGPRLFRTEIDFPANVPIGRYQVIAYQINKGEVIASQTTPLEVSKVGFSAEVYDIAHQYAALYGLFVIALAVGSGWLASAAFRRG